MAKVSHVAQDELGKTLPNLHRAHLVPACGSILVHQITARTNDQIPMNTSMKTLMVVAVMVIQPSL